MRAILLFVISSMFEIALQAIRLIKNQLRRPPFRADEIRLVVYAVLVTGVCERGNLCEDLDAARGEAEEAVDGVVVIFAFQVGFEGEGVDGADFGGGVVAPVVAGEERFFVSSSRERAQDIEIG